MTATLAPPRAWVGCLGCYNNGDLNGLWIEGADAGDVVAAGLAVEEDRGGYCGPFCTRCGADEFWVMDHENYRGLLSGECSPVEAQRLAEVIAAIEADHIDPAAVAEWARYAGERLTEWDAPKQESFEDAYRGHYESDEAFAQEWFEETVADQYQLTPKGERFIDERHVADPAETWPFNYIDWDRATADLMQGFHTGDAPDGGVFVFSY